MFCSLWSIFLKYPPVERIEKNKKRISFICSETTTCIASNQGMFHYMNNFLLPSLLHCSMQKPCFRHRFELLPCCCRCPRLVTFFSPPLRLFVCQTCLSFMFCSRSLVRNVVKLISDRFTISKSRIQAFLIVHLSYLSISNLSWLFQKKMDNSTEKYLLELILK